MAFLGPFDDIGLVHLDAETGSLRDRHEAVRIVEDFLVGDVVEDIVAPVVMNAEALFLDKGEQCGASATS